MKTIATIIAITTLFTGAVFAATPAATPSAAETTGLPEKKLDDLKERLATKVAELRQVARRAIYGTVTAVSVSTVTVGTQTNEMKIELTDEIKVFQIIRGKRTELTTEDVAQKDNVVVFGDYDSGLELLKAKVIFIQSSLPMRISGTVTDINKTDFTLTLVTPEGQSYIVDIEKNTQSFQWDKQNGLVKGGFSKMTEGGIAHIVGTAVPKQENRISADRILDLGNLTGAAPPIAPTTEASASAGKATPKPTTKTSPSPTPEP